MLASTFAMRSSPPTAIPRARTTLVAASNIASTTALMFLSSFQVSIAARSCGVKVIVSYTSEILVFIVLPSVGYPSCTTGRWQLAGHWATALYARPGPSGLVHLDPLDYGVPWTTGHGPGWGLVLKSIRCVE